MLKYLILGAGPTGLAIANRLKMKGETSFLVLEKEDTAGGLCRSVDVDGSPFDRGGIHLLEDGNDVARDFLFQFMPREEWIEHSWKGKIKYKDCFMDSPFEANIWQLDCDEQIRYLKDIVKSGCSMEEKIPENFVEWVYWKFGKAIAEDYMLPYNNKMFHGLLENLGIYWIYKLPDVSFEEVLRSCLKRKAHGKLPGYGKKSFYYPKKYGFGEVWKRMADNLGGNIRYGVAVNSIDFINRIVNGEFQAETIITTIPWTEVKTLVGMPQDMQDKISQLKYTSVRVDYHDGTLDTDAAWVYYPEKNVPYHRTMVRHNFCPNAKGYGTETNVAYSKETTSQYSYLNEYTYPVNMNGKPEFMSELLEWANKRGVIGIGRWGEWCHHNSDVVVQKGVELADWLVGRNG